VHLHVACSLLAETEHSVPNEYEWWQHETTKTIRFQLAKENVFLLAKTELEDIIL